MSTLKKQLAKVQNKTIKEVSMPGAYIAESENVNLAQDTRPGTRWSGYATITDGVKSTDRIDYFDVGIKVTYDDVGINRDMVVM